MSKLTKREVNAIASKLQRELQEKIHLERKRAFYEYIPSPDYISVSSKYDEIKEINNKCKELTNKKCKLQSEIQEIINKLDLQMKYWNDGVLKAIIESEIKIPKLPSLDELKDNITITAIDYEFNVENYIKYILEKY